MPPVHRRYVTASGLRLARRHPKFRRITSEPGRLERFDREARAIAALNHPHIITIYSTEEADGLRFLTMELVDGQRWLWRSDVIDVRVDGFRKGLALVFRTNA